MTLHNLSLPAAAWLVLVCPGWALGQRDAAPEPREVNPGGAGRAPSDAVVLFDGRDLSEWEAKPHPRWVGRQADLSKCKIEDGAMACLTGSGNLFSKRTFRDAQIHLEFAVPAMPEEKGQRRGNSGVYLQGRHEIQILDSYRNPTYAVGSCGALYGQSAPLVNVSRPPGEWQSFDIIFRAPRCDERGNLLEHGTLTLLHNGVLVQDHVKILGSERACEKGKAGPAEGPLMLQDHSGFQKAPNTLMRFRNIWFRPL